MKLLLAVATLAALLAQATPRAIPPDVLAKIQSRAANMAPLETDTHYDASVAHPTYAASHPEVLFDEAHNNFHTPETRYKPFADLITNDGYRVVANRQPFTAESLAGHNLLVIVNARGAEGVDAYWSSAFTDAECRAVAEWVRGGGALLLIADHAPFGTAAESLARALGVDMSKGHTADSDHSDAESGNRTFLVFSQENGLLGDHPIIAGRDSSERISRVMTFSGQSLRGPEGSSAFLPLGDSANDVQPPSEADIRAAVEGAQAQARRQGQSAPGAVPMLARGRQSAAGRAQGIAFRLRRGRVVVLGEAAMLSAQIGDGGRRIGTNHPGLDNRQLALNIMHWLSGALD